MEKCYVPLNIIDLWQCYDETYHIIYLPQKYSRKIWPLVLTCFTKTSLPLFHKAKNHKLDKIYFSEIYEKYMAEVYEDHDNSEQMEVIIQAKKSENF